MNTEQLINNSKPFLSYVGEWKKDLPPLPISDVIQNHPENVAVISVGDQRVLLSGIEIVAEIA